MKLVKSMSSFSMNINPKENSLQIKIKITLLLSISKDIIITEEKPAIKAEILSALNPVNCNHSFSSATDIGRLYGSIIPDSDIAKHFKLGETKMKCLSQYQ